jgi:hypothetical protein
VAQLYNTVTAYVASIRNRMQDRVFPYRYTDDQIVDALNVALEEAQRIRPDIFLDLKYQQRLNSSDLDDGFISNYYTTADITNNTIVPIPSRYNDPIIWYMGGHLQLLDIDDTQDQRAVAFVATFLKRMTAPAS